jgi:ABC-2 type transport system ATP-binding protein
VVTDVIELVNLTKKYGTYAAVDDLSLTIRKGEVFGLLGPNGAGKSTTILMMLGLTDPTSGHVRVCGINSTKKPIEVKRRVGYLPEDVGFYDDMTGIENLIYTARLNRIPVKKARERAHSLLNRVGLAAESNKKAGKYSRGMRQRLGLADVLIKDPEVIILDEPTLGIDPNGVHQFLELIIELSKADGITVLLSSHHLHQVQEVCDRVGLFVQGRLLAEGDIGTLSKNLFSSYPYIVEASVSATSPAGEDQLQMRLKDLGGVLNVYKMPGAFRIGCSYDISTDVARTIVESGFGLRSLQRKEYGLDDIYRHYFHGRDVGAEMFHATKSKLN